MLNQPGLLDRRFQALADPTRRGIVERLAQGPSSVSALAQPFAMSLPAVMQHLALLENAGLVVSRKAGRVRTVSIEPQALGEIEVWVQARRAAWQHRLDRLGAYLDAQQEGTSDADEQ